MPDEPNTLRCHACGYVRNLVVTADVTGQIELDRQAHGGGPRILA